MNGALHCISTVIKKVALSCFILARSKQKILLKLMHSTKFIGNCVSRMEKKVEIISNVKKFFVGYANLQFNIYSCFCCKLCGLQAKKKDYPLPPTEKKSCHLQNNKRWQFLSNANETNLLGKLICVERSVISILERISSISTS